MVQWFNGYTHIVKLVDVIFSVLTEGGIGRAGQLVTPIVDFSTTTSVKKIPATSFYKLRENSIAFFVVDPLTQISQNVFESEDFSPSWRSWQVQRPDRRFCRRTSFLDNPHSQNYCPVPTRREQQSSATITAYQDRKIREEEKKESSPEQTHSCTGSWGLTRWRFMTVKLLHALESQ